MGRPDPEKQFGWRGWVLVGVLVMAFVVVPAIITFNPPTWVSFRFAFLILPMFPAVLLGVVAVWAAIRS